MPRKNDSTSGNLPAAKKQTDLEKEVRKNLKLLLTQNRVICFEEFWYYGFRADMICFNESMMMTEVEIKTCETDYWADYQKEYKHSHMHQGLMANKFSFCLPEKIAKKVQLPKAYGLISFDSHGEVQILRRAPVLHENIMEPSILYCAMARAAKMPELSRSLEDNTPLMEAIDAVNFKVEQVRGFKQSLHLQYDRFFGR